MQTEIVTTCTRDCPSACGLVARVADGRVAGLRGNADHPLNKGGCCAKMKDYVRRLYSPERVVHPMLREEGQWRRIDWDLALDLLADRLKRAASESGLESILHYQGYGERTALKLLNGRFYALMGGVTGLRGTLCSGTAYAAMSHDFGERLSHDPLDHLNSCTVILWGRNPAATQFNLSRILGTVRKTDGRIWLVDPAATESLALCDRYVQVRPGADLHLALGVARVVLENGWEDRDFIARRSEGFAAYKSLVFSRTVEEYASLAGVEAGVMATMAKALCRERPAAILLGWGMHRHVDAHLGVRAIDSLCALTGNVGIAGGGVSQGFEEYGPYDQAVWGEGLHPPRRTLLMPRIGQEILDASDPPVRVMVISASNPACMAPDSNTVARAIESREFVAYMGHFMDDTARLADLFLPCATFLEEDDLAASYGHHFTGPVNKAAEPVGECRSQFDIYQDLARRFPFADEFIKPLDEWLAIIAAPLLAKGFTLEELRRGPVRDPDAPMVPWSEGPFLTPSGLFRFLDTPPATDAKPSRVQGDHPPGGCGAEPCRDRAEPGVMEGRGPSWPPEASSTYPLFLLTTGSPRHLCSELTLESHDPLPLARIHPDTAKDMGVSDGAPAWLVSELGRVKVQVACDPRQRKDTCLCRRGGWAAAGHGLNRIIPAMVSALGNGTPYYAAKVTLRPVDSEEGAN